MKKFKDYDSVQSYKQSPQLPIGGYVLSIKEAKLENEGEENEKLVFYFDIDEGPFRDFYRDNYNNQPGEDKKWKGTYRLWTPKDDGSERDDWAKRRFKTVMETFEESNEGFRWEWDEKKLKGLRIGGVFNQKEYDYNGRTGFFTQCKMLTTVEAIEKGTFKQPSDDYLDRGNAPAPTSDGNEFMELPAGFDEKLPFA